MFPLPILLLKAVSILYSLSKESSTKSETYIAPRKNRTRSKVSPGLLTWLLTCLLTIYRVRGYQFRSEGKGGPRKNAIAYRLLDDGKEKVAKATLPSPDADAEELEQQGFAERVE